MGWLGPINRDIGKWISTSGQGCPEVEKHLVYVVRLMGQVDFNCVRKLTLLTAW